ncbi:MAG: sigma 54-interacting transcriptional regulator [Phycisphaerales bacterium]|nr:sigma 54-interacting transcriptional regulator [Phycisphaerales bacterium]
MNDRLPANAETSSPGAGPERLPFPAAPHEPVPETDEIAALRAIVEGTAATSGAEFFKTLVRHLANAVGAKYAFVAEFLAGADGRDTTSRNGRARTIAYWYRDAIVENVEWDLRGTPCEDVVYGSLCHHASGVSRKYPADEPLIKLGVDSYLGVPLRDPEGRTLGHLAVFDDRPMPAEPRKLFIFRIFAARAAAELLRLHAEQRLRESERRYHDLFEESPIAYVQEGLDTRFIRANRAAMRALGITPDQVEGTYGRTFVVDTPENQRRLSEAFASVGRGADTSGVILELRRRDNGQPLWIQWWSRPDPSGQFTRTMFVDITEKVLMEQEQARLRAQNTYLLEEIKSVHNFEEIIGRSGALVSVLQLVERVAPTDASVLITGETGTGKELIARAIHSLSRRRDKPLIKVNCAALPTGLVESELFGHEKGAFSGAIARRIGRFELAHGGTIFLDEIGDVPLDVQVKLLRVLQEREFERVGGSSSIKADVRVIAATNRDLRAAAGRGQFREDLYFRLNVFPIHVPPLRERIDDIPLLVQFMLKKFAAGVGKRIVSVAEDTLDRLRTYAWPGNVRELENIVERAVILARGDVLEIPPSAFLPSTPAAPGAPVSPQNPDSSPMTSPHTSTPPGAAPPDATLTTVEREHILATLARTRWVIDGPSGAARILNLHPNTLRSRMKKLGIARPAHERS